MKKRGRKSAAELAVSPVIQTVSRPEPPYTLWRDGETEIWREIVNALPADYFAPEQLPLLAQLCRHIMSARRVAQLIADMEKGPGGLDLDAWGKLLAVQERETRAIAMLCRQCRISHVSRVRHREADELDRGPRPWEGYIP